MATSKRAAKPTKTSASSTEVEAKKEPTEANIVDAKLVADWRATEKKLRALVEQDATKFDARYELVADVIDAETPKYLGGGYRNFGDFCKRFMKESPRTVRRNVLVARCADAEEIKRFGPSLLEMVIQLLVAQKKITVDKGRTPVVFATVKVSVVRDGEAKLVLLPDASWDEVAEALRLAQSTNGSGEADAIAPVVREVSSALEGTPLESVDVRVKKEALTFGNVPIAWLGKFAELVGDAARAHERKRAAREKREDERAKGDERGGRAKAKPKKVPKPRR
ncbi:MAG: hypothetical protein JNK05_34470 [Myxococcales bacterium]|nr:hypothetical protein [Myxococcales bacterium]